MSSEIKSTVFFDRKSLDQRKLKPKPLVFYIYLCSNYKTDQETNLEIGAWCSLIIQQPQYPMSTISKEIQLKQNNSNTTYLLSGSEKFNNHIRIRLLGVKESLEWITVNVDINNLSHVETVLISNDVFVVNMLREWIPKWNKNNFKLKTDDEQYRPNSDMLKAIANVSTKIKLSVKWQSEKSYEMIALSKKVDEILNN